MKNVLRWDNLTWPEIKALASQDTIVILPVGAIEEHGPHIAVGCDSVLVTAAAELCAEELEKRGQKCVVAPTITVGNSKPLMGFPGTLTLSYKTFERVLIEYCSGIVQSGFKKIVVLNGHGGNTKPIDIVLDELAGNLGAVVYHMSYMGCSVEAFAEILEKQKFMQHACEAETSVMLDINPDLVLPIYKTTSGGSHGELAQKLRGKATTYIPLHKQSQNGAMGFPDAASPEKGRALVEAIVRDLSDTICIEGFWNR